MSSFKESQIRKDTLHNRILELETYKQIGSTRNMSRDIGVHLQVSAQLPNIPPVSNMVSYSCDSFIPNKMPMC